VVFRSIHYAGTSRAKPRVRAGIHPAHDTGRVGKVRGNQRRSYTMDGELAVYAKRREKAVIKWTKDTKDCI
jgi:hypothetical protein